MVGWQLNKNIIELLSYEMLYNNQHFGYDGSDKILVFGETIASSVLDEGFTLTEIKPESIMLSDEHINDLKKLFKIFTGLNLIDSIKDENLKPKALLFSKKFYSN